MHCKIVVLWLPALPECIQCKLEVGSLPDSKLLQGLHRFMEV